METSAKGNIRVEDAFFTLARDIKAKTERNLVLALLLPPRPPLTMMTFQQNSTTQSGGFRPIPSAKSNRPQGSSFFSGWKCAIL